MARYIDTDLLIKNIANIEDLRKLNTKTIGEAISNTPTAGVVEVVSCKDCIHNADNGGDCDRVLIHTHRNLVTETNEYLYFKLNYCNYGTPKERGVDNGN